MPVSVCDDKSFALCGNAQGCEAGGLDLCSDFTQRLTGSLPPGISGLLVPGESRRQHRHHGPPYGKDLAACIRNDGFAGCGAAVQANDKIR
jgi:hypothetical protein